jgi:heptosyltransferase-3
VNRILVIRGGAIGDFILTLPALKALRDAHQHARIEILGYKHIAGLVENRFYAQAIRSIEYGPLSAFFAGNSVLPGELRSYFESFDLIISYLYDPDRVFESNLHRCGVKNYVRGPARIDPPTDSFAVANNSRHAARQLARPIEQLGLRVDDLSARIYLSGQDREFAADFLRDLPRPVLAIHPGSGSENKNWPIENWIELARSDFPASLIISGEADEAQRARLQSEWNDQPVRFATNLPLIHLAAVLEQSIFIGHDSGISHLAAAAGARCILLFGPTDPAIWAPLNENVQVLSAPNNDLRLLDVDLVRSALGKIDNHLTSVRR